MIAISLVVAIFIGALAGIGLGFYLIERRKSLPGPSDFTREEVQTLNEYINDLLKEHENRGQNRD